MKYKHVFIITYGRTGSTLLQGVLNSIDGVVVRGENYNLCFGLYQAYESVKKTIELPKEDGTKESQPFFGKDKFSIASYLKGARELVAEQLAVKDSPNVKCWGFKEIRYTKSALLSDKGFCIKKYLSFMKELFPESLFVILTRDHEAVLKSAFWSNKDSYSARAEIEDFENKVADWGKRNRNAFWIDYSELKISSAKLKRLFLEIGAPFDEEKIASVLGVEHSYAGKKENLKGVRKVGKKWIKDASKKKAFLRPFRSVVVVESFIDGGGFEFHFDDVVDFGGAVLLSGDVERTGVMLALSVGNELFEAQWGLPSPKLLGKFSNNKNAANARFRFMNVKVHPTLEAEMVLIFSNGEREIVGRLDIDM